MNDKFTEAIDRAKSYVSKLAEEENNLPSNIDLNKIWQLNSRYIVSPIESAIVIIDQSLAHQRILYDGAIKSFNSSSFSSQTLLFPKKLKFESENFSDLLDALPYMNRIGFNMKKHDKNSVIIESIPSEMLWGNEIKIVNQMLEDFKLMINKELSKEEIYFDFSIFDTIRSMHRIFINRNSIHFS